MITLEKIITELTPESLNEIVGGNRHRSRRRRSRGTSHRRTSRSTSRTSRHWSR